MSSAKKWYTPQREALLQYILFGVLVVATPFVVVTQYLQGMVHIISHFSFTVAGHEFPILVVLAVLAAIVLIIYFRRHFIPRRVLALMMIAGMILFSHSIMDVYLDMSFFDLQQNWHYIAYGAYIFFFFRAFYARGMQQNKMILVAFASTIGMSLFDETFQFFLSHRVFDLSDIAKDAWGAVMGLILVLFFTESYGKVPSFRQGISQKRIKDYFSKPEGAFVFVFVLTLSFVITTPLLAEHMYWHYNLLSGFLLFLLLFTVLHLQQYKRARIIIIATSALLVAGLGISYLVHKDDGITYNRHGLTVYRGIPIPFYDFVIYPNGSFRLVDKKHHFRSRDYRYFMSYEPDIIVVGSGSQGRGGKGFPKSDPVQFLFNEYTMRGTQVIILRTPEACEKYNELVREGKNVFLVVHNTC